MPFVLDFTKKGKWELSCTQCWSVPWRERCRESEMQQLRPILIPSLPPLPQPPGATPSNQPHLRQPWGWGHGRLHLWLLHPRAPVHRVPDGINWSPGLAQHPVQRLHRAIVVSREIWLAKIQVRCNMTCTTRLQDIGFRLVLKGLLSSAHFTVFIQNITWS